MAGSPQELHVEFQEAFNRRDLESVVALYEPEAVLVSGDETVRGAAAIREAYRSVFAARPSIALQTLEVFRVGDLAMLRGKWTLHEAGADGSPVRREGRNMETARLQPDGRWLFVIDDPYGGG